MKVAIIGPIDSCTRIEEVMKKYFKNFKVEKYPVSKIDDAYLEAKKAQEKCAAIIFSGIGVYTKVMEKVEISLPHIYIPHLAASIMKPLWELKEKYPNCRSISIDSICDSEEVYDIFKELNLEGFDIKIKGYSHEAEEGDYVEFHKKNQEEKKNSVAIVGLGWVYEELKNRGYNAIRLYPIISTIRYSINELIHKLNVRDAKEATIAVQLIKVNMDIESDHYRIMEIKSIVEGELVEYLKEIQGSIFNSGWDQYVIYTTTGALSNKDNISLLRQKMKSLEVKKIKLAIGNGYSKTAYKGEMNAKKALKKSLMEKESSIYEVSDEKIKGPLLSFDELEYDYVVASDDIKDLSEKLKVNILYLKKIEAIIKKYGKNLFTSDELSNYLGISIRSGNRLIKKIIDGGYGKRKEIKSVNTVGRPKETIEIDLCK
ncbi:MAG: hypothetical protein ACRCXY_09015 [Fusobacteriaceae bacterium]